MAAGLPSRASPAGRAGFHEVARVTTPTPRSILVRDSQPRTPSSAYARCDECGTGAGESCYDSRDRPCSPCAGRVLASTGSLDRQTRRAYKKRKRVPKPVVPEPPPPPVVEVATPAPIPCWYCGVSIPLMGGHRGSMWVPCCTSPECRRGRKNERERRLRAARTAVAIRPIVECWHCARPLICTSGRSDHAIRPCCSRRICLQAIKNESKRRCKAAKQKQQSDT